MDAKWTALILAPIIGPMLWAGFYWVARKCHNLAWRKLPEGRLRSILLRNV
jgi:hypothetical protein